MSRFLEMYTPVLQSGKSFRLVIFFSKGWDRPWVSPPAGDGGAPRQGWLNVYEGVFYRLSLGIGGWKHDDNTDSYTGNLVSFTPINQRFKSRERFRCLLIVTILILVIFVFRSVSY